MKVAVVQDHFNQFGGAERVALEIVEAFPGSDLYTSVINHSAKPSRDLQIETTGLQRLYELAGGFGSRLTLPFQPRAFRRLDLDRYDAVVTSAAAFSKCVRTPPGVPHVSYCHAPTRFLWDLRETHVAETGLPAPARVAIDRWLIPALRRADLRGAEGVDVFIANSEHVADRIRRYYGRESQVIYPAVALGPPPPAGTARSGDYLLSLARHYPFKRVDLAIAAAERTGRRLVVCGDGPDRGRLEALAGPGVEFTGWVSEDRKQELLAGAAAVVAPQVEDFGLSTVEALGAGVPVLAFGQGGSAEIVEDGRHGVLVEAQTVEALVEGLDRLERLEIDRLELRRRAERFSPERFRSAIREVVERELGKRAQRAASSVRS